jgi:MULE transposase domain
MTTTVRCLLYSHGTISTGVNGVVFESEHKRVMTLSSDTTLDRLNELIRQKLRLSPLEEINSIVYRMPISQESGRYVYSTFNLVDDDCVESMMDLHLTLMGNSMLVLELYVEVVNCAIDLNNEMVPAFEEVPAQNRHFIVPAFEEVPTQNRNLIVPAAENFASSSVYRSEFDLPGGSNNIAGCSGEAGPSRRRVDDHDNVNTDYDEEFASEDESLGSETPPEDSGEEMDDTAGHRNNDAQTNAVPAREYRPRGYNFFNQYVDVQGADRDPEYVDETNYDAELRLGKMYQTKDAFKLAAKLFSIKCRRDFIVYKLGVTAEEYRCRHYLQPPYKCPWRVRAAVKDGDTHWTVTRIGGDHSCLCPPNDDENQDHRKLDSDVIASRIVGLVSDHPKTSGKQIVHMMWSEFGFQVSYKKAWAAKYKALKIAFGDWEESYNRVPRFLNAAEACMPGTFTDFKTVPMDDTNAQFRRAFWAFRPCIDAFPHLKPIVQVDGTFLTGRYKHTLLIACSQDGDRKIVPLAFAIVESEKGSAWKWFLQRLRRHVVGMDRQGVCLISDRASGIIEAVEDPRCGWQPPLGYHVFCLRHIASNVMTRYQQKSLKIAVQNIGMLFDLSLILLY